MRRPLSSILLVASLGVAGSLHAQSSADSVAVARAAARRFLKPSPSDQETLVVQPLESRLDSTLARMIAEESRDGEVTADTMSIRTLGLRMVADTAFLTVEMKECDRKRQGMNWWRATLDYLFVRTADGWRFTTWRPLGNADGSCTELRG